jgi:Lrp/AsnC family transcriptional regulator for asnA, asnC and gidA
MISFYDYVTDFYRRSLLMKIDGIDRKLIRELRDGRKSFGEIAQKLSITPNTARARVKKLVASGLLQITGVIDPGKMDNHFLAVVGVKLKNMNLIKKGEEFSRLKGVISVGIVTGQFDLIITVLLNNDFGLLEFITKEVSKVKDVLSTETFIVYRTFNLNVPYVL